MWPQPVNRQLLSTNWPTTNLSTKNVKSTRPSAFCRPSSSRILILTLIATTSWNKSSIKTLSLTDTEMSLNSSFANDLIIHRGPLFASLPTSTSTLSGNNLKLPLDGHSVRYNPRYLSASANDASRLITQLNLVLNLRSARRVRLKSSQTILALQTSKSVPIVNRIQDLKTRQHTSQTLSIAQSTIQNTS